MLGEFGLLEIRLLGAQMLPDSIFGRFELIPIDHD
jgi:hypothetical protein